MTAQALVEVPGFTWTDVEPPGAPEAVELLTRLGVAPHPWPEARRVGPFVMEEPDHQAAMLVGAGPGDGLRGVKCYVGPGWLVTVHEGPLEVDPSGVTGPLAGVDRVAKSLITSLVERVSDIEGEIDEPDELARADLDEVWTRVVRLRRFVLTQHDLLMRLGAPDADEPEAARGLRNTATRMAQVGTALEALREEIHEAQADRREDVMRRLTALAAVFLPLTVIASFFGQNFGWMVRNINGATDFVLLGLVLPTVVVSALLLFFWKRGWL